MSAPANVPTVMFADLVGSTSLYRDLGNEKAEAVVRLGLDRCRGAVRNQSGRVIKSLGDGLLCLFGDPSSAAAAALEIQKESKNALSQGGATIQLKIGFFAGPVIEKDGDVFGDAVNVASRLCGMAKAESILTTDTTSKLLPREVQAMARVFDHTPVKGVKESLTIVQLVWDRRSVTEMVVLPRGPDAVAFSITISYQGKDTKLNPTQLPLLIGRGADCGLVVTAPFASRHHAKIEYKRGKFMLVDQSTNGSYVMTAANVADQAIYIRDEAFPLLKKGSFSLGAKIEQQPEHAIEFSVG